MKISFLELIRSEGVGRRFLFMNSFDAILTVSGVLIVMFLSNETDVRVVMISCLSPAIALMISGLWSAYIIEKAERKRELSLLEKQMLKKLSGTIIEKRMKMITLTNALINGLSPLIISFLIIAPFFFSAIDLIGMQLAFKTSFLIVGILLFLLGVYVAKIGNYNAILYGLIMLISGILLGILILFANCLLEGFML
ncbi:MAG TPA: hypothetical protein ENG50_05010 [Candidatus Altiarchaeales archaeon]|nr:hypothetical protein [Candidatus Altiarchaeales archaeon]